MRTTIMLFANLFVVHDAMLFGCIEHALWHMTMFGDALDLWMGREFLLERIAVLQFGTFAWP